MMPGVKVAVEPAVMKWVLQTAEAQDADNDTLEKIQSWISGEKMPTFRQLEEVGKNKHSFRVFLPKESAG